MKLTRHQMAILTVASRLPNWTPGVADRRIREAFDINTLEFLQELNAIVALPEAEAFDPHTVRRLLRLRDRNRARWAAR